jgi:TIR domain
LNIFVSWSGEKAQRVAVALKAFLQDVNQRIIAWFSDTDMSAGERWGIELATRLETTDFGIICVTQESLHSQWVLFEAGALSRSVKGGRVCPYLIDVSWRQLEGPLAQFHAKEATKERTWEMLQSINLAMGDEALPEGRLEKYFGNYWPTLEGELAAVNRELQSLPNKLYQDLLDTLPQLVYTASELQYTAMEAGLPVWYINLNQAAIHVWRELIQLAVRERKLDTLVESVDRRYGRVPSFIDVKTKVDKWLRLSQESGTSTG